MCLVNTQAFRPDKNERDTVEGGEREDDVRYMTPDSRAALEVSIASSFLRFHQAERRFAQIAIRLVGRRRSSKKTTP
jgi:hypothetical protein